MRATGHNVFVMSYHTPSLRPGNTPYVRTTQDLEKFLIWIEEILDFFRDEIGGTFSTWRDIYGDALAATHPADDSPVRHNAEPIS